MLGTLILACKLTHGVICRRFLRAAHASNKVFNVNRPDPNISESTFYFHTLAKKALYDSYFVGVAGSFFSLGVLGQLLGGVDIGGV